MQKILPIKRISACCLVALALLLTALPVQAAGLEEQLTARAAVLMDAETGQLLYSKDGMRQMAPASVTKIMTGLLALEQLSPDELVTASSRAVDLPYWGSTAGIKAGEELTVAELMYAMMLPSANEAANILAEAVAGSLEEFTELMNRRAAELGAEGTQFTNAHGLPDRSHYTTAYDLALITRQAIRTPGFLTYFGAQSYTIPATGLSGARQLRNLHAMLRPDSGYYDSEVIGGKTGYTMQAGYTLVTVAQRGDRTLICVVLNDNRRYEDTAALLEYGFTGFVPVTCSFEQLPPPSLSRGDEISGTVAVSFGAPEPVTLWLPEGAGLSEVSVEYTHSFDPQNREATWAQAWPDPELPGEEPLELLAIPLSIASWEETAPAEPAGMSAEGGAGSDDLLRWIMAVAMIAGILCYGGCRRLWQLRHG